MDLQITKLHSLPLPCALAFYFSRFSFYVAISSVVILTFLFFCARPSARTISNRWPDHSLSFHYLYLYKYIYKNTADDISALWTRHRRYRFILWVFLCGSGISVSSVRIRLHCKHGSIQPDAILSRTLKRLSWAQTKVPHPELNPLLSPLFPFLLYPRFEKML